MKKLLATFLKQEDGAVTVDFVVLTAAIFLLGAICVNTFAPATVNVANYTANQIVSACSGTGCNQD